MAHPNEELVRRGYTAFAAADMQTLGELFAEDVIWHTPGNNPLSGDYKGQAEVFGLFAKIAELTGGAFSLDIHDVIANDEHAVALVTTTGDREGRHVATNDVHVFHVAGGKVTEFWSTSGDQAAVDAFWS